MAKSSRVIIIHNEKILLIHRIKNDKEYYVLPGGAIESGETPEEAAIREVKEETNLDVEIGQLLWKFREDYNNTYGYYFIAKKFGGNLKLGGPEAKKQSKNNKYILEWTSLKKMNRITLYPEKIKDNIIDKFLHH